MKKSWHLLEKSFYLLVLALFAYMGSYALFDVHTASATLLGKVNISYIKPASAAAASSPVGIAPQLDSASAVAAVNSVSLSTINGQSGQSLAVNIYQGYLVLPWLADINKGKSAEQRKANLISSAWNQVVPVAYAVSGVAAASGVAETTDANSSCLKLFGDPSAKDAQQCLDSHRTIPVYLFGHVTTGMQASSSTLAHELLDNEHGGLVSFKLTPILYNNATRDYPYGLTLFVDAGAKIIEAPTANAQTFNHVYAGYTGLGLNYELQTIGTLSTSGKSNNRVSGDIAFGFGAYRNTVNGIDSAVFSTPAPNYFTTYVGGFDVQLPGNFSLSVYRAFATGQTPYGGYTALSVKENF